MLKAKIAVLAAFSIVAVTTAATPAAAAFTLVNTNGGDGYVTGTDTDFDLFGSNNGSGGNTTAFTDVATKAQTYLATYTYTSFDIAGTSYDPAGLVLGVFGSRQVQLSPRDNVVGGGVFSGSIRFRPMVGDTFGFYVATPDGELGRADIAVNLLAVVPEPASWALMIAGFGLVGSAMRRRSALAA